MREIAPAAPRGRQPEDELLFSVARTRMTPDVSNRIRDIARGEVNWIRVIQLAMQHEITALLYWNLRRTCPDLVPAGVLAPLAARYQLQAAEARKRASELARVLNVLENLGIFAVAYKGPSLAQQLYDDIALREFSAASDLDIMIHERDLLKARDVLLDQGYRLAFLESSQVLEYSRTHRELHFYSEQDGGRALELQWRFMMPSARVQDDPGRFMQGCGTLTLAGSTVRSLSLETYLLVLSLHGTKHKWRKLKLVCDIAEILATPNLDWDHVAREAEHLGLRRMIAVGALLAEDPLQVAAPAPLIRWLKIDRQAQAIARECRSTLLSEPDATWRDEADDTFLLQMRERMQDRARMYLHNRLLPKITPDERDRQFVPMPRSLSALYYFVRPLRMAWEKMTEHA